jgi:hypothetical protein
VTQSATASYFDPDVDSVVSRSVETAAELDALIETVALTTSGRGCPALEVTRSDGSTLTVGTDGSRACLVWIDGVGDSFHSVGGSNGEPLVYDYMGSWSEAPGGWAVPLAHARTALRAFFERGAPSTEDVLFEAE